MQTWLSSSPLASSIVSVKLASTIKTQCRITISIFLCSWQSWSLLHQLSSSPLYAKAVSLVSSLRWMSSALMKTKLLLQRLFCALPRFSNSTEQLKTKTITYLLQKVSFSIISTLSNKTLVSSLISLDSSARSVQISHLLKLFATEFHKDSLHFLKTPSPCLPPSSQLSPSLLLDSALLTFSSLNGSSLRHSRSVEVFLFRWHSMPSMLSSWKTMQAWS